MAIEPVKIPQDVSIEDRIIGPVTLKQIIICLLSSGFSYMVFSSMKAAGTLTPVSMAISWTPAAIGAAFAFVKINGISLFRFCLLMIERLNKPGRRMWTPRRGITINISTGSGTPEQSAEPPARTDIHEHPAKDVQRIRELSAVLDRVPGEEQDVARGTVPSPEQERTTDLLEPTEGGLPRDDVPPRRREAVMHARPVDPSRVRAEPLRTGNTVVDGIRADRADPKTPSPVPDALVRDLHPPTPS